MNLLSFALVLFGVLLNAAAQLLLKAGTNAIGHFEFSGANVLPIGWKIATQPYIVGGLSCYVVSVDDGLVSVRAGREPDAEVVVTEDAATAAAVARGELSAHTAFMTGRIRVAGDIPALLACYEALGGADDAFGGVRAVTTW